MGQRNKKGPRGPLSWFGFFRSRAVALPRRDLRRVVDLYGVGDERPGVEWPLLFRWFEQGASPQTTKTQEIAMNPRTIDPRLVLIIVIIATNFIWGLCKDPVAKPTPKPVVASPVHANAQAPTTSAVAQITVKK